MTAFTDAQASLEASIVANKALIATQDTAPQLALAFGRLKVLQDAVSEWVRAEVSLQAMTAETEQVFDAAIKAERLRTLRKDTAELIAHGVELRRLIIAFAVKARQA